MFLATLITNAALIITGAYLFDTTTLHVTASALVSLGIMGLVATPAIVDFTGD
jgi:hypothetical protein